MEIRASKYLCGWAAVVIVLTVLAPGCASSLGNIPGIVRNPPGDYSTGRRVHGADCAGIFWGNEFRGITVTHALENAAPDSDYAHIRVREIRRGIYFPWFIGERCIEVDAIAYDAGITPAPGTPASEGQQEWWSDSE